MPTELQKQAFNIKLKKTKEKQPVVMKEVMLEAGYKLDSARKPNQLIKSVGWQELLNITFPDERLMQVHNSLLDSNDLRVRKEGLDMAYKLKDRYPASKTKIAAYKEETEGLMD
jgi:hypothetical protein